MKGISALLEPRRGRQVVMTLVMLVLPGTSVPRVRLSRWSVLMDSTCLLRGHLLVFCALLGERVRSK